MQQLTLFDDAQEPARPRPAEPALWIARLVILRAPRLAEDAVIRDVHLRRGLNVLWAPPSPTGEENRLFEGRMTGHTAGKTTFCRLVRYLLGEERFGAPHVQDRIRARLPDGWVAGEVHVGGEVWAVGRPFARGVHPFAARGVPLEAALETREGYQDFLDALEAATVAALPVRTLPHARRPVDWPLVLTWLARDQEARFAGVIDWRHPSSASLSPSPKVADRHVVLRAALDLVSDEERSLQQAQEALKDRRRQLEDARDRLRQRADDDRRRLAARLGLRPDDDEAGPLFAARLRARVEADREALGRAEAALPEKRAALDGGLDALLAAAEERGARRAGADTAADTAADTGAGAGADTGTGAGAGADTDAGAGADTDAAEAAHRERLAEHRQRTSALLEERAQLAQGRAALDELDRLQGEAGASQAAADANEAAMERLAAEAAELSQKKAARQRRHARALKRLSARFDDVVQALLGRGVRGSVEVRDGEVELHVAEQGERDGAAMETIKVLAFDLAALALALEGHGSFPGLLIHDGPREADMDEHIYERLFLYAEALEQRASAAPGFQYLVTTTAAPPERLRRPPWLLAPTLDASVPEGRLLQMNL